MHGLISDLEVGDTVFLNGFSKWKFVIKQFRPSIKQVVLSPYHLNDSAEPRSDVLWGYDMINYRLIPEKTIKTNNGEYIL